MIISFYFIMYLLFTVISFYKNNWGLINFKVFSCCADYDRPYFKLRAKNHMGWGDKI